MASYIYAYLRASTKEQDAQRAKKTLEQFCKDRKLRIAAFFIENISGTADQRPQLQNLLDTANDGDILLIEAMDRLTRLPIEKWDNLKNAISQRNIKIVALDVPTSLLALTPVKSKDVLTDSILKYVNEMMIDILAAVARKDYETRRARQLQGIEKAKRQGKYKGRKPNTKRNEQIVKLLNHGFSYQEISETLSVSKSQITKIKKKNIEKINQIDMFKK